MSGTHGARLRRVGAFALVAGGAVLAAGTGFVGTASAGKPGGGGGGGGTPISTAGVVAFGDGTSNPTRGTYAMSPAGAGVHRISTLIYPLDVSRGRTPVTVLVNGDVSAQTDIVAMRADGSGSAAVILSGNVGQARFSVGGDRIAYHRVDDATVLPWVRSICVADVVRDGAGDVVGTANAAAVYTSTNRIDGLDFTRDGSKIAFSMTSDLWTVRLSDGQLTQLTNTTTIETYPRCSANDDRIVYQRRATSSTTIGDILTRDATTGATTVVFTGSTALYPSYPCWSPDSTNVLVVAGGKNKSVDLYQIPAAGGSAVNVSSGTGIQENTPAWGW